MVVVQVVTITNGNNFQAGTRHTRAIHTSVGIYIQVEQAKGPKQTSKGMVSNYQPWACIRLIFCTVPWNENLNNFLQRYILVCLIFIPLRVWKR